MDTVAVNLAGGTAQTSTTKKGDDNIEIQGAVVTTSDNRDVESRGDGTYVDQGNGEVGDLDHWGGCRSTGEKD